MSKQPRSPLEVRLEKIRALTIEERERLGRELFAVLRVEEAMSNAAAQGFNSLTLTPPRPVELSATAAARELEEELKAAGVQVEWIPRRLAGPDSQPIMELVITW